MPSPARGETLPIPPDCRRDRKLLNMYRDRIKAVRHRYIKFCQPRVMKQRNIHKRHLMVNRMAQTMIEHGLYAPGGTVWASILGAWCRLDDAHHYPWGWHNWLDKHGWDMSFFRGRTGRRREIA